MRTTTIKLDGDTFAAKSLADMEVNRLLEIFRKQTSFQNLQQNKQIVNLVGGPFDGAHVALTTQFGIETVEIFVPPRVFVSRRADVPVSPVGEEKVRGKRLQRVVYPSPAFLLIDYVPVLPTLTEHVDITDYDWNGILYTRNWQPLCMQQKFKEPLEHDYYIDEASDYAPVPVAWHHPIPNGFIQIQPLEYVGVEEDLSWDTETTYSGWHLSPDVAEYSPGDRWDAFISHTDFKPASAVPGPNSRVFYTTTWLSAHDWYDAYHTQYQFASWETEEGIDLFSLHGPLWIHIEAGTDEQEVLLRTDGSTLFAGYERTTKTLHHQVDGYEGSGLNIWKTHTTLIDKVDYEVFGYAVNQDKREQELVVYHRTAIVDNRVDYYNYNEIGSTYTVTQRSEEHGSTYSRDVQCFVRAGDKDYLIWEETGLGYDDDEEVNCSTYSIYLHGGDPVYLYSYSIRRYTTDPDTGEETNREGTVPETFYGMIHNGEHHRGVYKDTLDRGGPYPRHAETPSVTEFDPAGTGFIISEQFFHDVAPEEPLVKQSQKWASTFVIAVLVTEETEIEEPTDA